MEIEEDILDVNPYRRVRVSLNVTNPLKRHQRIKTQGNNVLKIDFKYERLPHFCFLCDTTTHTDRDYSIVPDEERDLGHGWGLFLKVSPRKGPK